MPDLDRVSITIEPALLEQLDSHVERSGHANRSEAIRDLIRGRLVDEAASDQIVVASLTLVYDHRQHALAARLIDAAHDHDEVVVLSTLHVHLDHELCMEVSALRGPQSLLRHYADHLLGMKGVLHGRLVVVSEAR